MKTIHLTLPNELTVDAKIGEVRIMRGERNMLLLPLHILPIIKSEDRVVEDKKVEGETIRYKPETFSINMGSDVGRRISLDDLRLAIPTEIETKEEDLLVKILRDQLLGQTVRVYRMPQRDDATKYNVRLAPALKDAKTEDLMSLIKSMSKSATAKNDLAGAHGHAGADDVTF